MYEAADRETAAKDKLRSYRKVMKVRKATVVEADFIAENDGLPL